MPATQTHPWWKQAVSGLRPNDLSRLVFVVRAYGQQVWAGSDEHSADRIISEYARLGITARKHKTRKTKQS